MRSLPCNSMLKSSCLLHMHPLVPKVTSSQPSPSEKSQFSNMICTGFACPSFSTICSLSWWTCRVSEENWPSYWHLWCCITCWAPAAPLCSSYTGPCLAHSSCRQRTHSPSPSPGVRLQAGVCRRRVQTCAPALCSLKEQSLHPKSKQIVSLKLEGIKRKLLPLIKGLWFDPNHREFWFLILLFISDGKSATN